MEMRVVPTCCHVHHPCATKCSKPLVRRSPLRVSGFTCTGCPRSMSRRTHEGSARGHSTTLTTESVGSDVVAEPGYDLAFCCDETEQACHGNSPLSRWSWLEGRTDLSKQQQTRDLAAARCNDQGKRGNFLLCIFAGEASVPCFR